MLLLSPLNFLLSFPFAAKGWCVWHRALPGSPRARDPSPGIGFLPALGGCWDGEISTPGSQGSEAQGHQGQAQPTPSALLRATEKVLPGRAAVRVTCGGRVAAHDKGSVSDTGREELVRSPLEERGWLEPSSVYAAAPPNPPYGGPVVLHPRHSSFPHLRSPWGSYPRQGQRLVPYRGSACPVPPPHPVSGVCTGSGWLPRGSAVVLSITAEPLKAHEDKAPLSHTLQPPAQPQDSVLLSSLRKPEPDDQKGHLSRQRAPW